MSIEWEQHFPLATVAALSDHTPLLLNTRETVPTSKQPLFKFELGWLLKEGFLYLVSEV